MAKRAPRDPDAAPAGRPPPAARSAASHAREPGVSAPAPGVPVRAGGREPGLREGIALGALAAVAIVAAAVLVG